MRLNGCLIVDVDSERLIMRITSNRNWRQFVYRYDVPEDVLASQFDWTDPEVETDGFFKYKGTWYHLSQFSHCNLDGWDGSIAESWSCGVVIKVSKDCETYQVGFWSV